MKILQNFLFIVILFLISIQSKASITNTLKVELVSKMSNDTNVIKLCVNNMRLSLINKFVDKTVTLPSDALERISQSKLENIQIHEYIESTYPEFVKLNSEDKQAVFIEILNSKALVSWWGCIGTKIADLGVALLGTTYGPFVYAYFSNCIYATLIVDLAVAAWTGGTAAPGVVAAAGPETAMCAYIASGAAVLNLSGVAVTLFIGAIYTC